MEPSAISLAINALYRFFRVYLGASPLSFRAACCEKEG